MSIIKNNLLKCAHAYVVKSAQAEADPMAGREDMIREVVDGVMARLAPSAEVRYDVVLLGGAGGNQVLVTIHTDPEYPRLQENFRTIDTAISQAIEAKWPSVFDVVVFVD